MMAFCWRRVMMPRLCFFFSLMSLAEKNLSQFVWVPRGHCRLSSQLETQQSWSQLLSSARLFCWENFQRPVRGCIGADFLFFPPSKEHTIVYKSYTPFAPLQIQAMSEIASNMFAFFFACLQACFSNVSPVSCKCCPQITHLDFWKKHECQQCFCLKSATPPRFSKLLGFFAADVCCNVQNMVFFSKMVGKKLGEKKR